MAEQLINVVDPDTQEVGSIPAAQLPQALSQGYTQAAPEQVHAFINEQKYGSPGQQALGMGEAALSAGTLGLSTGVERLMGVKGEDIRGREEQIGPLAKGIAGGAGLIGSTLASFGAAPVLEGVGTAAKLGLGAAEAGTASKIAAGALKGAAELATFQGGDEISKMLAGDPGQSLDTAVANIKGSALMGAAFGMVPPIWSATKAGPIDAMLGAFKGESEGATTAAAKSGGDNQVSFWMKKAMSTFGGVSPENVEAYVKNAEAINAAPGYEEVYNHTLDHINAINKNLENAKSTLAETKSSYVDLTDDVKSQFRSQGYDAATASAAAKQALKEATLEVAQKSQQAALDKVPAITNAVEVLRNQAIGGSQKAMEVLEQSGQEVSLKPLYERALELQDQYYKYGTPESLSQAEAIQKYVDTVREQYQEKTGAASVKNIIQGLDRISKYDFTASSFDKGLSPAWKQIRYALDDVLKTKIPGYAEAMAPVAEKFSLLNKLDKYATEERATKGVLGLNKTANFVNDMGLLRDLEKEVGYKFTNELDLYASENLQRQKVLPHWEAAQKAAKNLEYYKHPDTLEALVDSLTMGEEGHDLRSAEKGVADALAEKKILGSLSEPSLQSKLNTTKAGKSIANRELLNKVPGFEGMSIPEILDLIKVRDAFEKGNMNGSRNVNLYKAIIGGAGGSALGLLGGPIVSGALTAVGASTGAYMDQYGPAIVKAILDKYVVQAEKAGLGASAEGIRHGLGAALGAEGAPSASGLKAAADYADNVAKGDRLATKAVKGLFKAGSIIIPNSLAPSEKGKKEIDKRAKKLQSSIDEVAGKDEHLAYYMPKHGSQMMQSIAQVAEHVNASRPVQDKAFPFDSSGQVSKEKLAEFDNILAIADQPLVVIEKIKDGIINPHDVMHLQAMYPGLYKNISAKLMQELSEEMAKGDEPPYRTMLGISMFLQQPLDSTMTGASVIAAQPKPQMPAQGGPKSMKKIGDLAKASATPDQARQMQRVTG